MLRVLDEADDFLQRTFRRRRRRAEPRRAPQIQRAGIHRVAGQFLNRRGFAGEVRLVGGGLAGEDFAVHGKGVAFAREEDVAGAHVVDGDGFLAAAGLFAAGGFGRGLEERVNGAAGAVQREFLQRAGSGKQKQQQRALAVMPDGARAHRHGEHEEMDVHLEMLQAVERIHQGVPAARAHRGDEQRRAEPRHPRGEGPGK